MEVKICRQCKVEKLVSEFYSYKDSRNKGGKGIYYKFLCKECDKKYGLKYKEASRKRKRIFLWNYKKTHPCIDCGECNPICLQFDHVNGNKFMDVGILAAGGHSMSKLKLEIDKCVMRCANCHLKKTAKEQQWYINELTQENLSIDEWNDKFIEK